MLTWAAHFAAQLEQRQKSKEDQKSMEAEMEDNIQRQKQEKLKELREAKEKRRAATRMVTPGRKEPGTPRRTPSHFGL